MANRNKVVTSPLERFKRLSAITQVAVLAVASLLPLLFVNTAGAAQLTNRSALIDNSNIHNGTTLINNDLEIRFDYDLINTTNTKAGIIYDFCTTPLGACTLPTGMNVQTNNVHDAQNGWPTNATPFIADAEQNLNDCNSTGNTYQICYSRDEAVATGTGGGAVDHTISGLQAPSSQQTVYIRISIYSDNDYGPGDLLDEGVVAIAFVNQLTINGRVQERLNFCVSAIDDVAAPDVPTSVVNCAALGDQNVDLGIITEAGIAVTPVNVTATNGADDDYGILMLDTNASAGASISYYPTSDVGGTNELGAFRVDNATCNVSGTSVVDQCFISAGNSGVGLSLASAGVEGFGMSVPCIDSTNTNATANLAANVPNWYNGSDNTVTSAANCENTPGTEFGWNDDPTTAEVITSSTSVVKDEVIKLVFGAQANPTTPSGEYTVTTNYIATVTF